MSAQPVRAQVQFQPGERALCYLAPPGVTLGDKVTDGGREGVIVGTNWAHEQPTGRVERVMAGGE